MKQKPGSRRSQGALVYVLSGPNLDRLGRRQPELYGHQTLADIHRLLEQEAALHTAQVRCLQSADEGQLVSWIHEAQDAGAAGILLNAAGYTHTSVALLDACLSVDLPIVEVHLTLPEAREPFRHRSLIAAACVGKVCGFGADSYRLGLIGLLGRLQKPRIRRAAQRASTEK